MNQLVVNFYRFCRIEDPEKICKWLKKELQNTEVLGTITIANEGLNGGLAGLPEIVHQALSKISVLPEFSDLTIRESYGQTAAYNQLQIKVKRSILTFPKKYEPTLSDIQESPNLSPEQWLEQMSNANKDLIILDTRNDYEFEQGSFSEAQHLDIMNFRDFPDAFLEKFQGQEDKTYLMFCTGGIRCEKAAAYARNQGFPNVFKLDGGIINYFKKSGREGWRGRCFVFDHRAAIEADRQESDWTFTQKPAPLESQDESCNSSG